MLPVRVAKVVAGALNVERRVGHAVVGPAPVLEARNVDTGCIQTFRRGLQLLGQRVPSEGLVRREEDPALAVEPFA
jgi:hypothetical protein